MFKQTLVTLVILSSTALFGTPSNIFFHNTIFFYLRWLVIKSHFLKSAHKAFLFKTGFEQMVLKYGVCFIRLQSFRHFVVSTIKRWELKNHFTR